MDRDDGRSGERDVQADGQANGPAEPRAAGDTAGRTARGMSGLAYAGLGFQFAVSLVVFYYLGQWLDRRLGTAPVFLLGCVLAGSGAAFYAMYRQLMNAQRRDAVARAARRSAGQAPDGSAPKVQGRQP